MNILVVNGSPKGDYSITLQTSKYIEKCFPEQAFEVFNAGQKFHSLMKDFSEAAEKLRKADMIVFSYPVYTFIAPSQLHYFIRKIKEEGISLEGKIATQITTSKHFYDTTAHEYVRLNCLDLIMKFIPGLSADMDDLLKESGRKQALDFFNHVLWCIENDVFDTADAPDFHCKCNLSASVPESCSEKDDKTIALLKDSGNTNSQLESMISRFKALSKHNVREIDLGTYPFKGGCLGCFRCAATGKCIHRDNFDDFLRNEIQKCDSVIFAFNITDHSMGPRFKMYDDRQFCNGHRTVTSGMPMGYLITGNLSDEPNLRMIIDGRGQVGGNYIAGIATNSSDPDKAVDDLVKNLDYALENDYQVPSQFLGVGGMKIFRDLIYLMQGLMKEDHRFYKERGLYNDFPQKQRSTIFKMKLVGLLMNNPKLMAKAGNRMNEGMIAPYRRIIDACGNSGKQ